MKLNKKELWTEMLEQLIMDEEYELCGKLHKHLSNIDENEVYEVEDDEVYEIDFDGFNFN